MAAPTLLRLSQLARFWECNPATIMGWIRQGRLAAIRSPGNHFRVKVADVRAFCEREGMKLPPFVAPSAIRLVTAAPLPRGMKLPGVQVEPHADPYDAVVAAAAGGAELLLLPASRERFDSEAAIAALRRSPVTAALLIVVTGATTHAKSEALLRAGATRVLRSRADDLPQALRDLLLLEQ